MMSSIYNNMHLTPDHVLAIRASLQLVRIYKTHKDTKRHKNTQRHTKTHKDTQRHTKTHKDTQRHTKTHKETQRHTKTHKDTQRHTKTHKDTQRHTKTHKHTQTHTKTHKDIQAQIIISTNHYTNTQTSTNLVLCHSLRGRLSWSSSSTILLYWYELIH